MPLNAYQKADPFVRQLWQDLCDKDDRNSPAEYPEMCLLTFEEFEGYLLQAARHLPAVRFTVEPGLFGSWRVIDNAPAKHARSTWQTEKDARDEAARLNATPNI